jgi:hypothetical protein
LPFLCDIVALTTRKRKVVLIMPENEKVITFLQVKKLVKGQANSTRMEKLQKDIDSDVTGVIYLYAKGAVKFEIKRYRNGRFVKRVWN